MKPQMFSNSSNATAHSPAPAMPAIQTRPRLSVVLLSRGPVDALDRAIEAVLASPFFLETELIVVRACRNDDDNTRYQRLARQLGFALEIAPANTPREILAGIGARAAAGDIITVREDVVAGDSVWLDAYSLPLEQTRWDSGVVVTDRHLADGPAATTPKGPFVPAPPIVNRAARVDRSPPPVRPHGVPAWRFESATEPAP